LSGGTPQCIDIEILDNGILYAGGEFTTAGGTSAINIAKWNGSTWFAMGSGTNGIISGIRYNENDGLLYIGGAFTVAGGIGLAYGTAIWNGTGWAHLDLSLPGTWAAQDFAFNRSDIYIGFTTAGASTGSYLNAITNNGTRTAYPRIIIERNGGTSAVVEWIKNENTGDTLWFNYSLLDGERITINLVPGSISIISTLFGNVQRGILRGSDLAKWHLLPGANSITVFVDQAGGPTMTQYIIYRNTYWGADGIA
jgi:hypothetical protein